MITCNDILYNSDDVECLIIPASQTLLASSPEVNALQHSRSEEYSKNVSQVSYNI